MTFATNRRHALGAALAAVSLLAVAGCGGSSEAADGDGVASLQTDLQSASDLDDPVDELSADAAALEFSQCLRDEGLDVADIGVDAEGNIDVRSALGDVGPGTEGFREALDACRDILESVGFGGGRGALADNNEIADALLEFSDCIRYEGFEDIADLTLDRPGAGGAAGDGADGDGPPEGRGSREGGFGDRSALFADRMGLDSDDPAVAAAMDVCLPIVDQAFTDAGVGAPARG